MDRYTEIQLDRILYELQRQTALLEELNGSVPPNNDDELPELPELPEPPKPPKKVIPEYEPDEVTRRT